jgi:hypothetical protein
MERACYRKLTSYKYQVMEDYIIQIDLKPLKQIRPKVAKFVSLSQNGLLTIKKTMPGTGPADRPSIPGISCAAH